MRRREKRTWDGERMWEGESETWQEGGREEVVRKRGREKERGREVREGGR